MKSKIFKSGGMIVFLFCSFAALIQCSRTDTESELATTYCNGRPFDNSVYTCFQGEVINGRCLEYAQRAFEYTCGTVPGVKNSAECIDYDNGHGTNNYNNYWDYVCRNFKLINYSRVHLCEQIYWGEWKNDHVYYCTYSGLHPYAANSDCSTCWNMDCGEFPVEWTKTRHPGGDKCNGR